MKKFVCIALSFLLCVGFMACKNNAASAPETSQSPSSNTDVHLNDAGYKILADLVYKKGVSLGYWK